MPLEMTCRVCGRPYEPTREDILRGPAVSRTCPVCRLGDELKGSVARPDEDPGVPV